MTHALRLARTAAALPALLLALLAAHEWEGSELFEDDVLASPLGG